MLEIRSLTKSFAETAGPRMPPVLDHIDLDVADNHFVCILGASGCGKTTLLRILAGLTRADSGSVIISGQRVEKPGQHCSMVFQNYGLLPWCTVMENVEFGLKIRKVPRRQRRQISQARIDQVGLTGSEGLYPHQISGGMQQRVALARAFAKDPRVLLMDEPFAAVDMGTRERLQDELLTIWSTTKTTVLFVTHSIEEAFYLADRVIVMRARPGRIVADIETGLPRPRTDAVKATDRFVGMIRKARDLLRPEPGVGH